MLTALQSSSFQNLQLDAGLFLKDFDYSTYKTKAALNAAVLAAIGTSSCIGATRSGGKFTATPSTREVEADGKRYSFVGSTRVDSWEIKLTGTMLEITPENFALALGSADIDSTTTSGITKVTLRTEYKTTDYVENLCWVGDTAKGIMLICLTNALNTNGAQFTFSDKGEGTLPFEFTAYQSDVSDYDTAPCEILFFE